MQTLKRSWNKHSKILSNITASVVLFLIRFYQYTFAAFLGGRCRFYPSCSEYTHNAVREHGPIRGVAFGMRRIVRCHPFGSSGVDPVPKFDLQRQTTERGSL